MCDCYCASKNLYKEKSKTYQYKQGGGSFDCRRKIENFYNPEKTNKFTKIFENNLEMGDITYPILNKDGGIEEVEFQEIIDNPLFFYKEFIAKNKPCKILNAVNDWPALEKWSDINYLKNKMQVTQDQKISVDLTPDGFADSVHGDYFIQPYQENLSFQEFLDIEEKHNIKEYVPYIQKQNGNLTSEFQFLNSDINKKLQNIGSKHFFEGEPDATNFWMGHENSVSALHKDHYENFYAVITGEKHFTLSPPDVYPYLGHYSFTTGYWDYNKQEQCFELDLQGSFQNQDNFNNQNTTYWTGYNIDLEEDMQFSPKLREIPKYHVVVNPGEVLYLPALWFHQVAQSSKNQGNNDCNHKYITAVNFWYDMQFDQKYRGIQMLQNMVEMDSLQI